MRALSRLCVALLFFIPLLASFFFLFYETASIIGTPRIFLEYWTPYVLRASCISLLVGITSVVFSTLIVFFIGYSLLFHRKPWVDKLLAFFLAIPHLAFFSGLLFLISSSGFLARLAMHLTGHDLGNFVGWDRDPMGISFSMALALKESVFLLFVALPILKDSRFMKEIEVVQSLGKNRFSAWIYVIWPRLLTQLRFPIWMTLAFSISVVDLAIVMGPTNPPPFSIVLWEFFKSSDQAHAGFVAIGSIHLVLLLIFSIATWELIQFLYRRLLTIRLDWNTSSYIELPSHLLILVYGCIQILPVVILVLWALTAEWKFPDLIPSEFSLQNLVAGAESIRTRVLTTVSLGFVSSFVSVLFCLIWFEWDNKALRPWSTFLVLLVPIFPSLPLLFGFQIFLTRLGQQPSFFTVLYAHIFYVFPYVFLILKGYFQNFEPRYKTLSLSFGRSVFDFFIHVRLRLLFQGILVAGSIGFAVSVAQYLSTSMIGAGRVETISTEVVVAAIGENRKWMGVYGSLQILLPFVVFVATQLVGKFGDKSVRVRS